MRISGEGGAWGDPAPYRDWGTGGLGDWGFYTARDWRDARGAEDGMGEGMERKYGFRVSGRQGDGGKTRMDFGLAKEWGQRNEMPVIERTGRRSDLAALGGPSALPWRDWGENGGGWRGGGLQEAQLAKEWGQGNEMQGFKSGWRLT
jgi:hypothetical protein